MRWRFGLGCLDYYIVIGILLISSYEHLCVCAYIACYSCYSNCQYRMEYASVSTGNPPYIQFTSDENTYTKCHGMSVCVCHYACVCLLVCVLSVLNFHNTAHNFTCPTFCTTFTSFWMMKISGNGLFYILQTHVILVAVSHNVVLAHFVESSSECPYLI